MYIGIVGNLAYGIETYNGQTTKARNYLALLSERYGQKNIISIDTYLWNRHPLRCIYKCFLLAKKCSAVVILPGRRGIHVIAHLFYIFKKIFKLHIFYAAVGGWLPDLLTNHKILLKSVMRFDSVYVETLQMLNKLELLGLKNAHLAPVFSLRKALTEEQLNLDIYKKPYSLCTFSRVTQAKGISEAIDAVSQINSKHNEIVCTLDIYGMVDEKYEKTLTEKIKDSKGAAKYCGTIDDKNVISTLAQYYLLVFPTYYQGEGFPATLLESMMSGLPSVVSNWKYNSELIADGKTGILFELGDIKNLIEAIEKIMYDEKKVFSMRKNCLKESQKYTAKSVMNHLYSQLDSLRRTRNDYYKNTF